MPSQESSPPSKKDSVLENLEADLALSPENLAALRRARRPLVPNPAELEALIANLPPVSDAWLRAKRGPRGKAFEL